MLTVVVGSLLAACGSSTKENNNQEPGPPVNLVVNSTTTQNTTVGGNAGVRPSVKVTDADGISVPGVQVVFAVTGGGGSLTGGTIVTNGNGVATVGSWTMGPAAGVNTLTATSAGLTGSPITFTATASAATSNYTIKLVYLTSATTTQQAAFENAKARWQNVVIGDLSNVAIATATACGPDTPVNETVDDVLILIKLAPIDGAGDVLGSAGPCLIRGSNDLTIVGQMTFDTADLPALENAGNLTDVILHEMGHVLGIGSLWRVAGLLSGGCVETSPGSGQNTPGAGLTPTFTGASALAAFTGSNGGGSATAVPVENFPGGTDGCPNGTRDSHWEEGDANPPNGIGFRSELMTGFISGTVRPMSLTTIRSLADLGYTVDNAQAQAFNINTQPTLRVNGAEPPVFSLSGDVRQGPIYSVDDRPGGTGAIRRVQ